MRALGRPRVHLRRIDSTSDRARALAIAGAPHGTLVTASEQSAGRGRQGRHWSAPADSSLLMSLVLRSPPHLLPLIAAVAVCDAAGADASIKWPNDVVRVGPDGLMKLAGILAEGRPQRGWAVLGIGLNVALRIEDLPVELHRKTATMGLSSEEIEPTLVRLLAALECRLEEPEEAALDAWRARDALRGRTVTWGVHGADGPSGRMPEDAPPGPARADGPPGRIRADSPPGRIRADGPPGRGRADGVDGAGRLIVALENGAQVTLDAGEVHLEKVG